MEQRTKKLALKRGNFFSESIVIPLPKAAFLCQRSEEVSRKICDKSRLTGVIAAIMKVSATIENTVKRQLLGW